MKSCIANKIQIALRCRALQTLKVMRPWQLSERDEQATLPIIKALAAKGLVVTRWKWKYIPEVQQFYFLVNTPSIAKLGPMVVLQVQREGLANGNIDGDIACRVRLIAE